MTTDNDGRPYALVSQVKAGDVLEADDGFTCLDEGDRLTVEKDDDGSLFVRCSEGHHNLDGQIEGVLEKEHYIGLYLVVK